jgi:hypothetical protein
LGTNTLAYFDRLTLTKKKVYNIVTIFYAQFCQVCSARKNLILQEFSILQKNPATPLIKTYCVLTQGQAQWVEILLRSKKLKNFVINFKQLI